MATVCIDCMYSVANGAAMSGTAELWTFAYTTVCYLPCMTRTYHSTHSTGSLKHIHWDHGEQQALLLHFHDSSTIFKCLTYLLMYLLLPCTINT